MEESAGANAYKIYHTSGCRLDILMALVIVALIAAGVYVGYHASQDESATPHGIVVTPEAQTWTGGMHPPVSYIDAAARAASH